MADRNHLNSEKFFEQWISFSVFNASNKNDTTPTEQTLEFFEKRIKELSELPYKKKLQQLLKTKPKYPLL